MSSIKLDTESFQIIRLFTNITGVNVKDCINSENKIIFVIENSLAKAVGKNGSNVKRLSMKFKKSIEIVKYDNDILNFFKNLVYPTSIGGSFVTEKSDGSKIINLGNGADKRVLKQKLTRSLGLLKKYHGNVVIRF